MQTQTVDLVDHYTGALIYLALHGTADREVLAAYYAQTMENMEQLARECQSMLELVAKS